MMSWFRRRSRNRRLEREHLLDVKLRSQQLRAARMRFLGVLLGVAFAITFVVLGVWRGGAWLLDRLVYENQAFAIRHVDVGTDGVIAVDYIRAWALLKPGQNLLALDLARVKRDLELVPLIQSASVERILPNTLRIRVSERVPVAQVPVVQLRNDGRYEQAVYHIDDQGFVFKPLDPRLRARPPEFPLEALPVISGIDARELRPGRRVESDAVHAALGLILELDHSPMFGLVDFSRIDLSTPEVLHAYTGQGSEVYFSMTDFDRQFRRWRLIYDQFQRSGKAISWMDLSVANNVPLRLVEAAPAAPRSRDIKPARPKRKNV